MPDVNAIVEDKAKPIVKAKPPQQPLDHGRLKLEQHLQSWFVTLADGEQPRETPAA
jgi:hypothetical protein